MNSRLMPSALLKTLEGVCFAPDRTRVTIGDRTIEADTSRELHRRLAEALYEILHAGQDLGETVLPHRIREEEFEKELAAAVPHTRTSVRTVVHERMGERGADTARCLVELDGLRVWVPLADVAGDGEVTPGQVVTVTHSSRRPAISPGFFLVDGTRPYRTGTVLRVYVHIAHWSEAAGIWGRVLSLLEERRVAYRAKVLSSTLLYPRRDALVVYLANEHRQVAHTLAEILDGLPGVGAETSEFALRLCPGVAVAWEPADSGIGMDGLSFGQHRASVAAQALMEAVDKDLPLAEVLWERFTEANIDPREPFRNLDSPADH